MLEAVSCVIHNVSEEETKRMGAIMQSCFTPLDIGNDLERTVSESCLCGFDV